MRPAFDLQLLIDALHGRDSGSGAGQGGVSAAAALDLPEPVILDTVDSTNAEVRRRLVPRQLVLTEHQVAGRGRLGRVWEDVPRAGLAMSVLVPAPPQPGWVPLVAGLALHRAVGEVAQVPTVLKWPNDVLVPADLAASGAERKLSGILCELIPEGVVVGIGVNVDQARDELPVETATSLRLARQVGGAGRATRREELAAAWLRHLLVLVAQLSGGAEAVAGVRDAYRQACATIGRRVRVHRPDGSVEVVTAIGVDDDGELVIEGSGTSATVSAGDVIHIRPAH